MNAIDFCVSVIIPIYGVENYIEKCARSLMEQTMIAGVEFIFVNDATKDNSMEVLNNVLLHYPENANHVKIVSHKVNLGLPAARNTGLKVASGEYIVHVDGDDFLEPFMLELLYSKVKENNADMAWCDYYITFSDKKRLMSQPIFKTPLDAVKGMLRGTMKYNVWNKICRRSLYIDNNIVFPEGYSMGEDLTMIMVALHAKTCAVVKSPLYNYVQNPRQMSADYTEEKLHSLFFNCKRLLDYIRQKRPSIDIDLEIPAFCHLIKWPFLLDGKISSFRRWHQWFPEFNNQIYQIKGINRRIKFVEWCAAKHLFPIVWIHYILVIKLYYGIVYNR